MSKRGTRKGIKWVGRLWGLGISAVPYICHCMFFRGRHLATKVLHSLVVLMITVLSSCCCDDLVVNKLTLPVAMLLVQTWMNVCLLRRRALTLICVSTRTEVTFVWGRQPLPPQVTAMTCVAHAFRPSSWPTIKPLLVTAVQRCCKQFCHVNLFTTF